MRFTDDDSPDSSEEISEPTLPPEKLEEQKKQEEFWSDPCWTEPLNK